MIHTKSALPVKPEFPTVQSLGYWSGFSLISSASCRESLPGAQSPF